MITTRLITSRATTLAVGIVLCCGMVTGCGEKQDSSTAGSAGSSANAPTASTGSTTNAGPTQGKISTGADPDKAPSYPNMYGKPAGAK